MTPSRTNTPGRGSATKPIIAYFPAHPAQVWMLRALAEEMRDEALPLWYGRSKDITLELMRDLGLTPRVWARAGIGLLGNTAEFLWNLSGCLRETASVDLWVSKYGAANVAARLRGKPNLSFNDDDADIVPLIAWSSYPFADFVLTPRSTRMGKFESRTLRYDAFHELFYLHPRRFAPDPQIRDELGVPPGTPYAIVRLSALNSHHDGGIRGMSEQLLGELLNMYDSRIRIFVTSEKPLKREFEKYRIRIAPTRIHHALAYAAFFVGDSQTMAAEAAVLGVPAFRINDFAGKISYLADLERAGLAFGFKPGRERELMRQLEVALGAGGHFFEERRRAMLAETIDPIPFFAGVARRVLARESVAAIRSWALMAGKV